MQEIEAYAAARGIKPATVLQYAVGLGGNVWAKWQSGASCQITTAERIREYIAENPSPVATAEGASCLPITHGDTAAPDQVGQG